jgi:hypothetical protein
VKVDCSTLRPDKEADQVGYESAHDNGERDVEKRLCSALLHDPDGRRIRWRSNGVMTDYDLHDK